MLSRTFRSFPRVLTRFSSTPVDTSKQDLIVERLTGDDEGIVIWGLNRDKVVGNKNALSRSLFLDVLTAFEDIRVCYIFVLQNNYLIF